MSFNIQVDENSQFEFRREPVQLDRLSPHHRKLIETMDIFGDYKHAWKNTEKQFVVKKKKVSALKFQPISHSENPCNCESEGNGVINITLREMSMIRNETYCGNWYVYLMSHTVTSKTDSYIGFTTNPLTDIYLLNQKKVPDERNTSMAAPHWVLDQVNGPIICKDAAREFARIWTIGTRGKKSKRNRGVLVAKLSNTNHYTFERKLGEDENLENLLINSFTAPSFLPILSDMKNEGIYKV